MEIISKTEAKALGLKYYFTGKSCRLGHIAKRVVGNSECRCVAHRALRKKHQTKWRQKVRELERKKAREYHRLNREEVNAKRRVANMASDRVLAKRQWHREWRKKNPERRRESDRRWRKNNPKNAVICRANRRARLSNKLSERVTRQDTQVIYARQKGRCVECKKRLKEYHIDHVMPLSLGGLHKKNNIQLLCPGCNLRKHNKHPLEWAKEQGRLL